jgi:3'(2'), 5'-bisphosphate nucleotidase
LVAEGKTDIYPRLSSTMEWDTGAAIIANESNVVFENYTLEQGTNKRQLYNKPDMINDFFIVCNIQNFTF